MQDPDVHGHLAPDVRKAILRSAGCLAISAVGTAATIAWGRHAVGPALVGLGFLWGDAAVGLINFAADVRARTRDVGLWNVRSHLRLVGGFCVHMGWGAWVVGLSFLVVDTIRPIQPGWMSVAVALAAVGFNLQVAATQIRPLLPANQRNLSL